MSELLKAQEETEFKQFLDTLKRLGIDHEIYWDLREKTWPAVIKKAGYEISPLGCLAVRIGSTDYVFSKGQACWDKEERGYGPDGVLMFSRNWATGKITPRVFFAKDRLIAGKHGLDALKAAYPYYNFP